MNPTSACIWAGSFATGYCLCLGAGWLQRYLARRRAEQTAIVKRAMRFVCEPKYAVRRSGDCLSVYVDGRLLGTIVPERQEVTV